MRHILLFPEYTKYILTSRGSREDREKIKIMIETGNSSKLVASEIPSIFPKTSIVAWATSSKIYAANSSKNFKA